MRKCAAPGFSLGQEISENHEEYGFVSYKAAELLNRENPDLDSYVGHRAAAEGLLDGHIVENQKCVE